jgi:hypothetical protein
MIIIVPEPHAQSRAHRGPAFDWPFEMEHRRRDWRPGGHVEEVLSRPREVHMHSVYVERESLVTVQLLADGPLELWALHENHKPLRGPVQRFQEVLPPDMYWFQVRAAPPHREPGGHYRLKLHCVSL